MFAWNSDQRTVSVFARSLTNLRSRCWKHMIHMMFVGLKSCLIHFGSGKKFRCSEQQGSEGWWKLHFSPRCLEMRVFLQLSLVIWHSWQILYRCFTVRLGKSSSNRHLGSFAFILPTILSKPEMFFEISPHVLRTRIATHMSDNIHTHREEHKGTNNSWIRCASSMVCLSGTVEHCMCG